MSMILIDNASIWHGKRCILDQISFNIESGLFVFLTGNTGSGKSSLLKLLYADEPWCSGQGSVASFCLDQMQPEMIPLLRRKLGIVFQDFQLLKDRTVEENLRFVLESVGERSEEIIQERISEVLHCVSLLHALKRMPHQLSGGEQQRIAIARALINRPILLLADEPTGNLDRRAADDIFMLFHEINQKGTTLIVATHHTHYIKTYAHKILCCQDQRVTSKDPTSWET